MKYTYLQIYYRRDKSFSITDKCWKMYYPKIFVPKNPQSKVHDNKRSSISYLVTFKYMDFSLF